MYVCMYFWQRETAGYYCMYCMCTVHAYIYRGRLTGSILCSMKVKGSTSVGCSRPTGDFFFPFIVTFVLLCLCCFLLFLRLIPNNTGKIPRQNNLCDFTMVLRHYLYLCSHCSTDLPVIPHDIHSHNITVVLRSKHVDF